MSQPPCVVCGEPAFEASTMGTLCRGCAKHVEPRCDFCSDLDPCWRYPAKSFLLPDCVGDLRIGSRDDWLACDACRDLIEVEDRKGLARRTLDGGIKLDGEKVDSESRLLRLVAAIMLHDLFRANRIGAAIRKGSA